MKQENLRFFYEMSKKEIDFLRDRQHKIFVWTSSILLASIGLLLISNNDQHLLFDFSLTNNKIIFSFIVSFYSSMSIIWIYRNRSWHRDHMIILTKIEKVLKAYKKGYYLGDEYLESLFPEKWLTHNQNEQRSSFRKLISSDYNVALLILSVFTLTAIWIY